MKKITLFFAIGLLSSNLYAASTKNEPNTLPILTNTETKGGFFIGGSWMYLRPSENNGGMIIGSQQYTNGVSNIIQFKTKYHSGYGINAGYDIPNTNTDIFLNYESFDTEFPDIVGFNNNTSSFASYIFTNVVLPTAFVTNFSNVCHLRYRFNKLDLAVGHHFKDVIGNFSVHPSIGLRYASIKHDFDATVTGNIAFPPIFAPFSFNVTRKSHFEGVGPLLGLDARYDLWYGFGLVGRFYSALLIGNINSNTNFTESFGPLVDNFNFTSPTIHRVVTAFDGKLGLDYSYAFCNLSKLTLEAGYQASKYYDAINLIRGDIAIPIIPGSSPRVTEIQSDNFDLNGPYINLTYHF